MANSCRQITDRRNQARGSNPKISPQQSFTHPRRGGKLRRPNAESRNRLFNPKRFIRKFRSMHLNTSYLQELSDIFVDDLKRSDYYRGLPADQQRDLDDRLATDASEGHYPLLPGAEEAELKR